jgi:hypothetical protein
VIFDGILNRAPVAPVRLNPDLPSDLERIINRALEKDRELRFQHAADMRSELLRLKRDTNTGRVSVSSTPAQEGIAQPAVAHKTAAAASVGAAEQSSSSVTPLSVPEASGWKWRKRSVVVVLGAFVIVSLVLGVISYSKHRTSSLTEKDGIVVAEFSNRTGESVFEGTLKQALIADLEQSPFLNVLSENKVGETLRLMGRPATDRVTEDIAQEVCLRTSSKAYLGLRR